jgi:hypothetical protein
MITKVYTADELSRALKEIDAKVLGTISLSAEQRDAIKQITGISTSQLDLARSKNGELVFAMPSMQSW